MSAGGEMGGRGVDVFWRRCLTRQGTGCGVEGPRTAHHGRSFPYREFRSEIGCGQLALSHSVIHTPAGCCGSIQSSFTPPSGTPPCFAAHTTPPDIHGARRDRPMSSPEQSPQIISSQHLRLLGKHSLTRNTHCSQAPAWRSQLYGQSEPQRLSIQFASIGSTLSLSWRPSPLERIQN